MKTILLRIVSLLLGVAGLLLVITEPFQANGLLGLLVSISLSVVFLIYGLGGEKLIDKALKDKFFTQHYLSPLSTNAKPRK